MIGRRRRPWPRISHNGPQVPGEVKKISESDLSRLTLAAVTAGWSARGRPSWLEVHIGGIESIYLTARVVESPEALRCLVTASLRDGAMLAFTLDVSRKTFDRLPTITPGETVELLHSLLATPPFLPVDSMAGPNHDD